MRIVLLCLLMLSWAAEAQASGPSRHGRALVREFCGKCHAVGLRDRSRHPAAVPLRKLGERFDLDALPRSLDRGISGSHPAMPQVKFSPEDARDLRDYLRSIQR